MRLSSKCVFKGMARGVSQFLIAKMQLSSRAPTPRSKHSPVRGSLRCHREQSEGSKPEKLNPFCAGKKKPQCHETRPAQTKPPRGEDPELRPRENRRERRRGASSRDSTPWRQGASQPAVCIFKPWQGRTRSGGG